MCISIIQKNTVCTHKFFATLYTLKSHWSISATLKQRQMKRKKDLQERHFDLPLLTHCRMSRCLVFLLFWDLPHKTNLSLFVSLSRILVFIRFLSAFLRNQFYFVLKDALVYQVSFLGVPAWKYDFKQIRALRFWLRDPILISTLVRAQSGEAWEKDNWGTSAGFSAVTTRCS